MMTILKPFLISLLIILGFYSVAFAAPPLKYRQEATILPISDNLYDLGTTTARWRDIFTVGLNMSNLLVSGSTTLQNFTFQNATGTSATTTNFFSTTASSTNLFFTSGVGNLTGNLTGNITGTAPAGTLTGTTLASNVVTSSLTTIGTLVTGAVPASLVTAGTFGTGAYVMDTSLTVPTIVGGTLTTSDLNLKTTSGVGTTGADMHFLVGNNGATEAMTILNSGFVGINTNAPANRIQVVTNDSQTVLGSVVAIAGFKNENTTNNTASVFSFQSTNTVGGIWGGARFGAVFVDHVAATLRGDFFVDTRLGGNLTEKFRITGAGNVGIGTTTPQWKTQISGTAAPQLTLSDSGLATSNHWSFRNSNGILYFATSSPTSFATSTVAQLTIDGLTGDVGLGTTTPGARLVVNGDIATDGAIPTLSACGTSPSISVGSTDTAGTLTEGSIATGCVITFAVPKANTPFCVAESDAGLAFSKTVSNTAITITNIGALSSTGISYICIDNQR